MILPVAKLGALLMKTLGKPLASRLKFHATRHPRFRQVIINFAQSNHRFQVNLQRRIYGHDTTVVIHPLDEEKAVQAASDILGEFIIFVVGGTIVILEVQRSSRSEARKEEAMRAELEALRNRDECSLNELANLRQRIDELERIVKEGRTSWIPGMSILRSFEETTEITSTKVLPPPRTSKTTETSPNSIPKNL